MDKWHSGSRRSSKDASPIRMRHTSGGTDSPATPRRGKTDYLCPNAKHASPSISPKRTPGNSTSHTPSVQSPALRRQHMSLHGAGKSSEKSSDEGSAANSPTIKKKGGYISTGHSPSYLSPKTKKKFFTEIQNDANGEAKLEDWYRKNGLGPEMLVDMPLVRKVYMSNIQREVGREMHQKPQETKDISEEEDEMLQKARSNSRRFSSFLSKEAQMASLKLYEKQVNSGSDDDEVTDDNLTPEVIDPEELAVRLQKAMDRIDNTKEHKQKDSKQSKAV